MTRMSLYSSALVMKVGYPDVKRSKMNKLKEITTQDVAEGDLCMGAFVSINTLGFALARSGSEE